MNNLIVSIIMPYYKKDKYIYETIESILKQTFQNFEIIIVDDERTNQSSKIMKKLKDKDNRIIVVENKHNLGAGLSRNKAVRFPRVIISFVIVMIFGKDEIRNSIEVYEK